jgi:uncharacterized Tic20 family protein
MSEGYVPVSNAGPEDRKWAMVCHLSALCAYVGIPFGQILGPLVVWLMKRDESALVDYHGRQALNFNITVTIIGIILLILVCLVFTIPLMFALPVYHIIFIIIATIRANDGVYYYYPLTWRFF